KCLKERIQNFVLDFQTVGMSLDSFLEIVTFYLNSTVIEVNDDLFIQKSGICIESCIAPVLSELYLEYIDVFSSSFVAKGECIIKRFVDDIIIVGKSPDLLEDILQGLR